MSCDCCKNIPFGGPYHLHHQGEKNHRAKSRFSQQSDSVTSQKTAFYTSIVILKLVFNLKVWKDVCIDADVMTILTTLPKVAVQSRLCRYEGERRQIINPAGIVESQALGSAVFATCILSMQYSR
jgi:hypothetical protein